MRLLINKRPITSFQIIILGFFVVIMIGTLLLMLPFATREYGGASFFDALFTATSATCVTGLVVQDTAVYWSVFGQCVILLLIQTGGLGVVTMAVAIAMISGRKIGLMQRSTMKEAISAPKVGGIVRMTSFILKGVFLIELSGAVILSFVFCQEFGLIKGIWYAIFHSISAFCNAGFDLMGVKTPFSSLMEYQADLVVNLTIMVLIIIGGIGFFTWEDITTNKFHIKKYRMQTKVVLSVSIILIVLPTLYFYWYEFRNLSWEKRAWSSVFQAVTPRTAGFNSVDFSVLSEVGLMIMIILMLIGGSPGSTAGGMKTTTIAVMFAEAFSVFSRKEGTNIYKRRVTDGTARDAATIFLLYIVLFLGGGLIISSVENIPVVTALFETASAIGTVGLTLGVTPELSLASRLILILLMFFGRVGGLTLIFAAVSEKRTNTFKYPQEKITVG